MATFKGVISRALPEQSGVSKSGKQWRKRVFVLTYDNSNANWPKEVVFDVVNDNIEKLNLQAGMEYEVEIDFAVKEWQGRLYQSAAGWKATPTQQAPGQTAQPPVYQQTQTPKDDMGDDSQLPF